MIDEKRGTWGPFTVGSLPKGQYVVRVDGTFVDRTNPKKPAETKVTAGVLVLLVRGNQPVAQASPLRWGIGFPNSRAANTISASGTYSGTPDKNGPLKMVAYNHLGGVLLSAPVTFDEKAKTWTARDLGDLEGGETYHVLILMKFVGDPNTYCAPLSSTPVMKPKK